MMPVLVIGKTKIPYRVRLSEAATRRRIVVTPGKVEVIAPAGSAPEAVAAFVEKKRRWVYEKVEAVNQAAARIGPDRPDRYATGAKVLYRGRRMKLTVVRAPGAALSLRYRSGFHVTAAPEASDREIRTALERWMKERVRVEVATLVKRHSPTIGATPKAVRVKAMAGMWGSCGAAGFCTSLGAWPRPQAQSWSTPSSTS